METRVILIIMDGWGIAENPAVSAIDAANTPFYDHLLKHYPHARLQASGTSVGLPAGQMGNSEVGHMNIGAGRIVYQELERITRAITSGEICHLPAFKDIIQYCKSAGKPLHLLGLVSDGGVHSHIQHLKGLISLFTAAGVPEMFVHAFTDGRDTDPQGARKYIADLEHTLKQTGRAKLASVIGRYYAMDRDNRWGRIRKAFDLLTLGAGKPFHSAAEAIEASYAEGITDEFILPCSVQENGKPVATIKPGDAVLFFNFRTDRGRQLTYALTQEPMREYNLHPVPLHFTTFTRYDESFKGVNVIFEKEQVNNGLGEYLSSKGKTQVRIAETEKYPHVTFFFNGGREQPWPGEERILCPSPRVATYDMQPEMSAEEIRDSIIPVIRDKHPDFICLNFANPDMVGHTGVFEAAVKACETVDRCVKAVSESALEAGYSVLITADHGNADKMKNPDGTPNTAHTTAPVPVILLSQHKSSFQLRDGKLGDLAPTILQLMGLEKPNEMTGLSLIHREPT